MDLRKVEFENVQLRLKSKFLPDIVFKFDVQLLKQVTIFEN